MPDEPQRKGRLVACDIDGKRLDKARVRLKRAGLSDNVEIRPLDEKRHKNWLKRQHGNFDTVLVDAPCSGTGTWRRNPDTRWFRYGPDIDELLKIQDDILSRTSELIKPGGRLVYATCSILPRENEDQIDKFLNNNPGYKLLPVSQAWPENQTCPEIFRDKDMMHLTPDRHNTDGFFAAVIVRI